jgi:Domain of unknown function (DUF4234)
MADRASPCVCDCRWCPLRRGRLVSPYPSPRHLASILLFIVTFGFYSLYRAFRAHEEMKQHAGEGVGGMVGLVIWILLNFVGAFVIPSEVGM